MKLSNRGSLIIAGVIAAVAVVAAVVASGSAGHSNARAVVTGSDTQPIALTPAADGIAIPELGNATAWDNTAPLNDADLKGKVVLIDFWDASCINCRRTFPFLKQLYNTYKSQGLVIVGVHTPEFDFEKAHSYVARATAELGITWPVAEDPNMQIWDDFGNQYWPAQYLVDRNGKYRGMNVGEGNDGAIETAVRTLLNEGGSAGTKTVADTPAIADPAQIDSETPELYMGSERDGQDPPVLTYGGKFNIQSEYRAATPGASVTLKFFAKDVYSVLAPPGSKPVTLKVTLDGAPVPAARRGSDLKVGPDGSTLLVVSKQDLFHIITGTTSVDGTLVLTAVDPGAEFFTFTFGS